MSADEATEFVTDVIRSMTFGIETVRQEEGTTPEQTHYVQATVGQWILAFYAAMPPEGQAKVRELLGKMRRELPASEARDN